MGKIIEREGYIFEDRSYMDLEGDDEPSLVVEVWVDGCEIDSHSVLAEEQLDHGYSAEDVIDAFLAHPERDKHVIRRGHWAWDEDEQVALHREWLEANGYEVGDDEASPYARRLKG